MSLVITGITPEWLPLIREQFEICAGQLRRRVCHQVDVCVALDEAEQGLERVGGEPVTAVVGHMRHEDRDGVGQHSGEQLAPLDTVLKLPRAAGILIIVKVLGKQAAGLTGQDVNVIMDKATPLVSRPEIRILLTIFR